MMDMSNRLISRSAAVRCLAYGLAVLQVVVPAAPAFAAVATAPLVLTDQPLFSVSQVKPNVMFTLDNSGSMDYQFAPMYTSGNAAKYCFTSASYNALYYNPANTYLPPILADGATRMANASYTAAWIDGFKTSDGTRNLTNTYPAVNNYGANSLSASGSRGGYYMDYNAGTPTPGTCHANANYTLVEVNAQSAAQQQNFANWFSYYRTRILAMKTSAGEAFRVVDDKFRVGLMTINNPNASDSSGTFIPLDTFTGTHRANWYSKFYLMQPNSNTPLRLALQRVGEYYRTGASPAGGSTPDPVQYSCQANFNILSTDGQWNSSGASGTVGSSNWDRTLPNNANLLSALTSEFGTVMTSGSPWPRPYRENSATSSTNTLSDIAAYYWMTDLRPSMANNVFTTTSDPAFWQHMVTYGLAFSEQGNVTYPTGLAAIVSGASQWPVPAADSASAVDDLWHAALVGHGKYFNVKSPNELMGAIGEALADVQSRQGSNSGAQLSGTDLSSGPTPVAFRAIYQTGSWTGDVQARTVDVDTGSIAPTAVWKAQQKLETLVATTGWNTSRFIATRRDDTGVAVPFRYANLSAAQKTSLDADATLAGKVLDYVRGDRSNEDGGGVVRLFRQRDFVLGDIVDSEPRYVAAPNEPYADAFNTGYSAFKATTRTPMIYVGSNDGMLHAFKATVGDADSGFEKWAYIPSMMYNTGVDGLAGLTYRDFDPLPKRFSHRYRVDQTPMVRDVDFGRTNGAVGAPNWRTLLVSGLNKGGKGYFALDVTDPTAASEAAVASKVLWEFKGEVANDPKMGYTYGQPVMFKTRRFGWVVAVTSGYNNVAGTGHVWLLNPTNGAVLHRFDTGVGSAAVPSGLAHINVFFQSDKDYTAEQIYGADLMGNLWRFDVSSAAAAGWSATPTKVASVGEIITSPPAIALNPNNQAERWVFFGSGKLLNVADLVGAPLSRFYAIKDGSGPAPLTTGLPIQRSDLVTITPATEAPTGPAVKGWTMDMTDGGGGQIIQTPFVSRGVVIWTTTVPTTDPCAPGASSVLYARALGSGGNRIVSENYLTLTAGVVKIQAVKAKPNVTGATNSQSPFLVNVSDLQGGDLLVPVNLQIVLTGGRSNLRMVTTQ